MEESDARNVNHGYIHLKNRREDFQWDGQAIVKLIVIHRITKCHKYQRRKL